MAGFNFGAFFGGGSSSDPLGGLFSSFNFSDYNSIRSGSYKKLVSAYYNKEKTENVSIKSAEKNSTIINYKEDKNAGKNTEAAFCRRGSRCGPADIARFVKGCGNC